MLRGKLVLNMLDIALAYALAQLCLRRHVLFTQHVSWLLVVEEWCMSRMIHLDQAYPMK
jgi:hypothetical protein